MNGRGTSLPSCHAGIVDKVTASCATKSAPRRPIASMSRSRDAGHQLARGGVFAVGVIGDVAGKRRSDHHRIQLLQDFAAAAGIAEPPCREVGNRQVLPEHRRRQRRQEAEHRARFDHAGAERIGDRHRAVAHRLHQAGHAQPRPRAQFERVGEIGVEPAQQHFGALEAGHRADEDAVLADGEVLAFDQKKAEIAREIGVLEIGFVQRSRRQHADAGVVLAVERRQLRLKGLEERRQPLDAQRAIDVRHRARERDAVLQGVAGAGGRLGAIAEHPPSPFRRTADVDGVETQIRAARRRGADHRTQEFRIACDHRRRQPSVADEFGRTVDVLEDRFEQLGALNDPGLERLPFLGVDQQRNVAQQPRANGARRILVDPIEHAGIAQVAVRRREPPVDFRRAQLRQHPQERAPVLAHPPVAVHHLIEIVRARLVARQDGPGVRDRPRRAVEMGHRTIKPESVAAGRGSSDIPATAPPAEW